jgi:uncharacterized protein (TIGR00304 family)
MSDLATLGIIAIVAGVVTIVLGTLFFGSGQSRERGGEDQQEEDNEKGDDEDDRRIEVKGGGVILIGPIPIIFGTDIRWTVVAIALSLLLVILSLFLTGIW